MAALVESSARAGVATAIPSTGLRRIAQEDAGRGRHRLGLPGLIPVTALVRVVRRGLFASWLRPGRHRRTGW